MRLFCAIYAQRTFLNNYLRHLYHVPHALLISPLVTKSYAPVSAMLGYLRFNSLHESSILLNADVTSLFTLHQNTQNTLQYQPIFTTFFTIFFLSSPPPSFPSLFVSSCASAILYIWLDTRESLRCTSSTAIKACERFSSRLLMLQKRGE
jgi:hypothetical protein